MSTLKKVKQTSRLQRRVITVERRSSSYHSSCGDLDAGDPKKTAIALRFQDLTLRRSDVRLLQGACELNDRVMSFYYAYMQSRRYRMEPELHFLMPGLAYSMRSLELRERRRLVRELNLASKQFIFMPLSADAHWSLLLFARPDRKFYYFDSEDSRHVNVARLTYEYMQAVLNAEDYAFTIGRCLQQGAGQQHESGIHLMCMTENMADYVSRCGYATSTLLISIQEVRAMRASQLQLIRTLGGILPASTINCHSRSVSSSKSDSQ